LVSRTSKVRLRPARQRRASSSRWLTRQLNDPFVQQARREGYRSRAAYKLIELDRRFDLLRPGRRVLDLGCAPGGWLQVAAERRSRVVGVDLLAVPPVPGATVLQGDIFEPATAAALLAELGGPADLLLSDVAASTTGRRTVDRLRAEAVGEAVLALVPQLLVPGGHVLIKLVRGVESALIAAARGQFRAVRLVRPEATRRESSEIYLLGLDRQPAPVEAADTLPES
jgi:23S rRNA (uridine2552-2'-O)-methyltransferase